MIKKSSEKTVIAYTNIILHRKVDKRPLIRQCKQSAHESAASLNLLAESVEYITSKRRSLVSWQKSKTNVVLKLSELNYWRKTFIIAQEMSMTIYLKKPAL